jgi:pimeloyl-ACP methyl ester carboxylesterase
LSKSEGQGRDPLFFLAGGPGEAAIDLVIRLFSPMFAGFLDHADLIVVDQRGTGRSQPSLSCPEGNLAACRSSLTRQGIDLGSYTTAENAADINDVRLALGYRSINLLGGSYGTLLAQAVMRDYPATVRSAILDSPAPLQALVQLELVRHFEPALQALFGACQSDADCVDDYPQLREKFYDVVERLNAKPVQLRVPGGRNGPPREFAMTGGRFAFVIWQSLYYSEAIPHLPRIVFDTAAGNNERLARLIEKTSPSAEMSVGMQQSVECAEMAPFMKRDQFRLAAAKVSPALRQVAMNEFGDIGERCRIWDVPPAAARVKEPLRSGIPMLLLSGALDPATPPDSARRTAEMLSRHYLFVFPDSGHGVFRTSECARELIGAFLVDPARSPSHPCLAQLRGPVFVRNAGRAGL